MRYNLTYKLRDKSKPTGELREVCVSCHSEEQRESLIVRLHDNPMVIIESIVKSIEE